MGTYWYIEDLGSEEGLSPVFEDDYVVAIFRIAKKNGVNITDKMILKEVQKQGETQENEP